MIKLADVSVGAGRLTVYKDKTGGINPFRVYAHYNTLGANGYGLDKHKKLIVKYADYASALYAVYMIASGKMSVKEFMQ